MDAGPLVNLLSPGLVAAIIAAGAAISMWRQVVGFAKQASNYVVGRCEMQWSVAGIVIGYLCSQPRTGRFRAIHLGEDKMYSIGQGRTEHVVYEQLNQSTFFTLYRWRPVLVTRTKRSQEPDMVQMMWIRGTINIRKLVADAARWTNNREHESGRGQRFRVVRCSGMGGMGVRMMGGEGRPSGEPMRTGDNDMFRSLRNGMFSPISHSLDDLGVDAASGKAAFEVYSFDGEVMAAVEEARAWHKSGQWYRERGIPWTLGWLLTGPPGTGKSSAARAVAQDLDLPVFVFDLGSMSNGEFVRCWRDATTSAPCMVVFEDIDSVFDGRKNSLGDQGGGLTFDCLLNCLSGVEHSDGVFTVFTTNHPELIDPAIAQMSQDGTVTTRPGRVDRIIALGPMSKACRMRHANRLLCSLLPAWEVSKLVDDTEGMTAAQFADRCTTLARANAPWVGERMRLSA